MPTYKVLNPPKWLPLFPTTESGKCALQQVLISQNIEYVVTGALGHNYHWSRGGACFLSDSQFLMTAARQATWPHPPMCMCHIRTATFFLAVMPRVTCMHGSNFASLLSKNLNDTTAALHGHWLTGIEGEGRRGRGRWWREREGSV